MKPLTLKQFARLGGNARAKKLTKERRKEIARNAGIASANKRKQIKIEQLASKQV